MKTVAQVVALLMAMGHSNLPQLELGDRVPAGAADAGGWIVVSPAQTQSNWRWNFAGIDYTLGVDEAGYVQYISTRSQQAATSEGVHVGMRWSDLSAIPGVRLGEWPGWGKVADLPSGWMAMSSLGLQLPGHEIPPSTVVDALFKGTSAGYGARKPSQAAKSPR